MLINLATTKLVINLTFVIKLPARGAVGRLVGMLDDATVVGLAVGLNDGTVVGNLVRIIDGAVVGLAVDGTVVGLAVGIMDGTVVGRLVGSCDGTGVYRTSAEEDHPKVNT